MRYFMYVSIFISIINLIYKLHHFIYIPGEYFRKFKWFRKTKEDSTHCTLDKVVFTEVSNIFQFFVQNHFQRDACF